MAQLSEMLFVSRNGTEICIICKKDTGIPALYHIEDARRKENYVKGSGQLCESCADHVERNYT